MIPHWLNRVLFRVGEMHVVDCRCLLCTWVCLEPCFFHRDAKQRGDTRNSPLIVEHTGTCRLDARIESPRPCSRRRCSWLLAFSSKIQVPAWRIRISSARMMPAVEKKSSRAVLITSSVKVVSSRVSRDFRLQPKVCRSWRSSRGLKPSFHWALRAGPGSCLPCDSTIQKFVDSTSRQAPAAI